MYVIKSDHDKFLNINEGKEEFFETLLLSFATKFESKNDAISWLANNTDFEVSHCSSLDKKNYEVVQVTDNLIARNEAWAKTMIQESHIKKDNDDKWNFRPTIHKKKDILQFWVESLSNQRISQKCLNTWPKIHYVFDYVFAINVAPFEKGFTFTLAFPKERNNFLKFKEEMGIMMSTNPTLKMDKKLYFHVYDELDSNNSVRLMVIDFEKDIFRVGGFTEFSGTLEECFKFLTKHLHY